MASEWENVELGNVASVRSGYAFKSSDWTNSGVPVVKIANVKGGRLEMSGCSYVDESTAAEAGEFQLTTGDILIAMTGYIGDVARVRRTDLPCVLNQRVGKFSVRDAKRLDADFLYTFLAWAETRQTIEGLGYGSAQPNVSPSLIHQVEMPLPPLAEQKAIAAVLGALDDKIELNRRMNATLEAMARALFQSWFVDFDPVRAKLDGRQPTGLDPATAALFPEHMEDSALGPIPRGWTVGTIGDATSLIIDYRGRTPKKMGSDWSPTGIPAVSAKNVKGGRLVRRDTFNFVSEELYERWMKDKLELGDILMTSEAPLGELYYLALEARFCLSQRIFAMRAKPAVCEPAYLYYWLESAACQTDILNRGTGTTVEGIRQSELRKVSVLLPPLSIQRAAAKFLAAWTEQIHRNEEQSRTIAALRDSLLPRLLSGELSVSDIPHSA